MSNSNDNGNETESTVALLQDEQHPKFFSSIMSASHRGELQVHKLYNIEMEEMQRDMMRDYFNRQHSQFFGELPFLVVTSRDDSGRIWTTLLARSDGPVLNVESDNRTVTFNVPLDAGDPLSQSFSKSKKVGTLGIMLHNRRRNRFNGVASLSSTGALTIRVEQAFGNCPQYINERNIAPVASVPAADRTVVRGTELTDDLLALVRRADTMFLGSGSDTDQRDANGNLPQYGMDSSHRGGPGGFVTASRRSLQYIDRKGNNLYNTIGNLVVDPRIGVLFVDFETGSLLQITGRATIGFNDSPERDVSIAIDEFVWRPYALPVRWTVPRLERALLLAKRVRETRDVTSFYFVSANPSRPLDSFVAGQYLPIRIGDQERTYSLSGPPDAALGHMDDWYRISVKNVGRVSSALHGLAVGSKITATSRPQGEFVLAHDVVQSLVLIGGGVGVTPLVAMAHSALNKSNGPRVVYVVSGRDWNDIVLRDELIAMSQSPRMTLDIHLTREQSETLPSQLPSSVSITRGRVDSETLRTLLVRNNALNATTSSAVSYYVCGPTAFMSAVGVALAANGVERDSVNSETFGPSAL